MSAHAKTASGSLYAVKQIRGPYLELPPHAGHTGSEKDLAALCADLRAHGVPLAADLFSGAGGLSLGLRGGRLPGRARGRPLREAVETHRHHFPGLTVDWDLADPNDDRARRGADRGATGSNCLAGGPPCQPFSKAGRSMIRHRVRHGAARSARRAAGPVAVVPRGRAAGAPTGRADGERPDMALDKEMFILRTMVEELEQLGYAVRGAGRRHLALRGAAVPAAPDPRRAARRDRGSTGRRSRRSGSPSGTRSATCPRSRAAGARRRGARVDRLRGPGTEFQTRDATQACRPADAHKLFDHITRPVRDGRRAGVRADGRDDQATPTCRRSIKRYRDDIFDDKYKRLDENDLSRTITAHIAKDGYWYIHPRQDRDAHGSGGGPAADLPGRFPVRRAAVGGVQADRQRRTTAASGSCSDRGVVVAERPSARPDCSTTGETVAELARLVTANGLRFPWRCPGCMSDEADGKVRSLAEMLLGPRPCGPCRTRCGRSWNRMPTSSGDVPDACRSI